MSLWWLDVIVTLYFKKVVMPWAVQEYPSSVDSLVVVVKRWRTKAENLDRWDVEWDFWWAHWKDPGRWMRWKLANLWCIDLKLKWQLTAAEKATILKSDSNKIFCSQKSWQNLIGLTEYVNDLSQLIELVVGKGRERENINRVSMKIVFLIGLEGLNLRYLIIDWKGKKGESVQTTTAEQAPPHLESYVWRIPAWCPELLDCFIELQCIYIASTDPRHARCSARVNLIQ